MIVRWTKESSLADFRLENHSRVCIIGGGPAGSFAALHLLRLSKINHLHLEVMIFEPRDFTRPGPSGCNRCAGILSSRLWSNLSELSLSIPEEIVQADLKSYNIHLDHQSIHLDRPDPSRRIISVYRGGGPRLVQGDPETSFDQFLLSQAVSRGAVHVPHRVRDVQWEGQPVLSTANGKYSANLVVLASGINSRSPMGAEYNYRSPKTEVMAQDEVFRPTGWDSGEVNAYFRRPPGLRFGAIIPKGRYLNISLLGKGFTSHTVNEFIIAQNLTYLLQQDPPNYLCGCNPRISVSAARNYYGDQWVAVGDAAVTRLYKDGIGSAYSTSRQAMSTALQVGISADAFRKFYAPVCQSIDADNFYGLLLYRLWNFILISPWILNIWKTVVQWEMSQPAHERRHTNIIWGMLTGDEPYRQLFYRAINLISILRLGFHMSIRRRGG